MSWASRPAIPVVLTKYLAVFLFAFSPRRFFAYRGIPAYVGYPVATNRFIKSVKDELENAGLSIERQEFIVDMGGFSFSYVSHVQTGSLLFIIVLPLAATTRNTCF